MTPCRLELGGSDRLVALLGDVATVLTQRSLPTGMRVELAPGPEAAVSAPGKVIDALRSGSGFRVRVRLFSAPHAAREALQMLLDDPRRSTRPA